MKRLLLVLFVIGAVAALWSLVALPREPVWQGRPASYWLLQFPPLGTNPAVAARAFNEMGSNALPCILDNLHARDSVLRRKAFTLARRCSLHWFSDTPALTRQSCALQALGNIGPSSVRALPEVEPFLDSPLGFQACETLSRMGSAGIWPLARALEATNPATRQNARFKLESLPLDADLQLAILAAKLREPDPATRRLAAQAFGVMRLRTNAVTVLAPHLDDPDLATRRFAVTNIYRHGTRRVVVPLMRRALTNSDDFVRQEGTNTLHILLGNPHPRADDTP